MSEQHQPTPATKPQSLLMRGLGKTRAGIMRALGIANNLQSLQKEQLEAALISADCGVKTTQYLLQEVESTLRQNQDTNAADALQLAIQQLLVPVAREFVPKDGEFSVILLTGTNGSGKTTTAAKLCQHYSKNGRHLMLAAADTFRAAATEQLKQWAERCNVPMVSKQAGADPASVCYEALQQAQQANTELLIIDTAGRQQNNEPMLQELQKIRKVIDKAAPAKTTIESWIVLDATTGQNSLLQAREFAQRAMLTGAVISKLDSSARGGMILAMAQQLQLPVRFIGIGEQLADLQPLNPSTFAKNLIAPEA